MPGIHAISAVFFDMDGTLIDSEILSEPVIRRFLSDHGINEVSYRWSDFYGIKWEIIAKRLAADHGLDADVQAMATHLHRIWDDKCIETPPPPIPGAREAVAAAHARGPTAIVSSAFRESIDTTVAQLELAAHVTHRIGAEDYGNSKPAPDGFLHAARVLAVSPEECLVFEDSIAGIQSARAAGMSVIAITHRSSDIARASELADQAIPNYESLDSDFFDRIR